MGGAVLVLLFVTSESEIKFIQLSAKRGCVEGRGDDPLHRISPKRSEHLIRLGCHTSQLRRSVAANGLQRLTKRLRLVQLAGSEDDEVRLDRERRAGYV